MINVKDFAIKLNGQTVVPTKHNTFLGVVLQYEYNNECINYPMTKWEEDHAYELRVIDHIKRDVTYDFNRKY